MVITQSSIFLEGLGVFDFDFTHLIQELFLKTPLPLVRAFHQSYLLLPNY